MINEAVDMGFTLVLVPTGIMVISVIILIGEATKDICWMSSRKTSHLNLMEKSFNYSSLCPNYPNLYYTSVKKGY